jgi:hypothetical protein
VIVVRLVVLRHLPDREGHRGTQRLVDAMNGRTVWIRDRRGLWLPEELSVTAIVIW